MMRLISVLNMMMMMVMVKVVKVVNLEKVIVMERLMSPPKSAVQKLLPLPPGLKSLAFIMKTFMTMMLIMMLMIVIMMMMLTNNQ